MAKIEDFGKKIGGARKDLWKSRGLMLSDLDAMNDREKEAFVKKDNVWPKPDWKQLIADGVPIGVAYWQNEMRKTVPTGPQTYGEDREARYITVVTKLRDCVMSCKTPEDIYQFFNDKLIGEGFAEKSGHWGRYYKSGPSDANILTTKMLRAADMNKDKFRELTFEAYKKDFGLEKGEGIDGMFQTIHEVREITKDFYVENDNFADRPCFVEREEGSKKYFYIKQTDDISLEPFKEGSFVVVGTKTREVAPHAFATKEEAIAFKDVFVRTKKEMYLKKQAQIAASQENENNTRKKKFVPEHLENIERTGFDYLNGANATGDKYLQDFKFPGGEFGNWVSDKERQIVLNMGYNAFRDLSAALNIKAEEISLGGTLSIAFGARGRSGAAAHYESMRKVINLTKMNGAGCVAHEWAHALDDRMGVFLGTNGMLTKSLTRPKEFEDLITVMQYKLVPIPTKEMIDLKDVQIKKEQEDMACSIKQHTDKFTLRGARLEKLNNFYEEIKNITQETDIGDRLQSFAKELHISSFPEEVVEACENCQFFINELKEEKEKIILDPSSFARRQETDFYKGSQHFDQISSKESHGYWASETEMFARAFDCYIEDKLKEAGIKSDYLSAYASSYAIPDGKGGRIWAVPMGDERKEINKRFDKLIEFCKEKGILAPDVENVLKKAEQAKQREIVPEKPAKEVKQTSLFER